MGSDVEKDPNDKKPREKFTIRTPTDIQRIKLQKLMDNPNKEVIIPTQRKKTGDGSGAAPSFVRNVMGSSAGAGSGEFHVYRHLRRKEYARQKGIQQKSKQEELDEEFRNRLEQNRMKSEGKTAKKRAKRLRQKEKAKVRKLNPNAPAKPDGQTSSEESDDEADATMAEADDKQQQSEEIKETQPESNLDNVVVSTTNPAEEVPWVAGRPQESNDVKEDVTSSGDAEQNQKAVVDEENSAPK